MVNRPPHYTNHSSGVECIEITRDMGFCLGNAFKYLFRHGEKGRPLEDLAKALWYVNREIHRRHEEFWAVFPDDPRYEISTQGRVRWIGKNQCRKPVPSGPRGYHTFLVSQAGRSVLFYVHVSVARTFIREPATDEQVCHRDGNLANNRLCNLRIGTALSNAADRRKHGTQYVGGQNPSAKLTQEQVTEIRNSTGTRAVELARQYQVARATIERILSGQSWGDPRSPAQILVDRVLDATPEGFVRDAMQLVWRAEHSPDADVELPRAAAYLKREIKRLGGAM
jgi:hypothetical protein